MIRGVIENLAVASFNKYILNSQDDKRNSSILLVVEARGFFRQQGALVSGVSVWLGLPGRSGMGRCPHYRQAICTREYQSFPNIGTDKLY